MARARRTRRRRWTRRAFIVGAAAFVGAPLYGYVSSKWLRIERTDVRLPRLPRESDGLRVVALADTHVGRWRDGDSVAKAVRKANAEEPDLVVLLGDYCHHMRGDSDAAFNDAIGPFGDLAAPLGVFAIPGNHDYWDGIEQVSAAFDRAGIPLLVNEHRLIDVPGGELAVVALDDLWVGEEDVSRAYDGLPESTARLTLSHNPDRFIVNEDEDFGLMLSGHTHGGQVVIPFHGPIRLPIQHKEYAMGLHERGHDQLYVSRGVGVVTPPIRLFCPPEISLIRLRAFG